MAAADPRAATAQWLAQLDPHLLHIAGHAADAAHRRWAFGVAAGLTACWLLTRSGLFRRLQSALERDQPRPWTAAAACAGVLAFALSLTSGALQRSPAAFLSAAAVNAIVAAVLAPLLLMLMRRSPRRWWAWASALAAVAILAVVWGPYAAASGPVPLPVMPAGPARSGLLQMMHAARLPAGEVYVSPSARIDADVTGLPGRARVVLTRGTVEQASPAEIKASVGHLMGHFAHGDQLGFALLVAALTAIGLGLCAALFRPAARLMGAGKARPEDPHALPVLAAIAIVWMALCLPIRNGYIRWINVRADQYSLDHAREPDGLALSLVKAWNGDRPAPSAADEWLFYDHPSLKSRIAHAMAWKAANTPGG